MLFPRTVQTSVNHELTDKEIIEKYYKTNWIGRYLVHRRKQLNLTQHDLAKLRKITQQTVCEQERQLYKRANQQTMLNVLAALEQAEKNEQIMNPSIANFDLPYYERMS